MTLFALQTPLAFATYVIIAAVWLWPWLRKQDRATALSPLVAFHMFRFMGLSILAPGAVDDAVPDTFRAMIGYGDMATAILAMFAVVALVRRLPGALLLVWAMSLVGLADVFNAAYQGATLQVFDVPLGTAWQIVTIYVPALWVTHGLILILLLRPRGAQ